MRIRRLIIPAIVVLSLVLVAGAGVTTALIATKAQAESTPPEAPEAMASSSAVAMPVVGHSIQPNPQSDLVTNQQPPQPHAPSAPNVSDSGQHPIPKKSEPTYAKLGSFLNQLATRVEEGEATAEEAAGETPMHRAESVAVTFYLSGNVDGVVAFLEENGGDPRNVGEDYIEAYVPVSLPGPASEQPGVLRVRVIVPPEPNRGG